MTNSTNLLILSCQFLAGNLLRNLYQSLKNMTGGYGRELIYALVCQKYI